MEGLKKADGITDVEDLAEFDTDDINNIIQNLRLIQDFYHPIVPTTMVNVEVPSDLNNSVTFSTQVLPAAQVDESTKKQAPFV